MMLQPRPLPTTFGLSLLVPGAAWFIFRPLLEPAPALPALYTAFGFSLVAFLCTLYLVPALAPAFAKAGLKGKDRAKVYDDDIPESLGLVCAATYILLLILFIPFPFSHFLAKSSSEGLAATEFPHFQVSILIND